MNTWADDIGGLIGTVSQLLVAAPAQKEPLVGPAAAVAARNAVVAEVRALIDAVSKTRPRGTKVISADDLVTRPVSALSTALAQLPLAEGASTSVGVGQLRPDATPVERLWHEAAKSCIFLESYVEELSVLNEGDSWKALRDLADLAAAIPEVDADLAEALPTNHPAVAALTDVRSHGVARLSAQEARARIDTHLASTDDSRPPLIARKARPRLLRPGGVDDLPEATHRLATVLADHSSDISMAEVRSVTNLLRSGFDHVGFILDRPANGPPEWRQAAVALREALPALEALRRTRAESFTPGSVAIPSACRDISRQLDALAGVASRLPPDAPTAQWLRVAQPAVAWAATAPELTEAIEAPLRTAMERGNMLVLTSPDAYEVTALKWTIARPGRPGNDDLLQRVALARFAMASGVAKLTPSVRSSASNRPPKIKSNSDGLPGGLLRALVGQRSIGISAGSSAAPASTQDVRTYPRTPRRQV